MSNGGLGGRPVLETQEKIDEWDRRWAINWGKYKKCQDEAGEFHGREADNLVKMGLPIVLAIDAGSILFGWLFVWGVTAVVRWVHRGFVPG